MNRRVSAGVIREHLESGPVSLYVMVGVNVNLQNQHGSFRYLEFQFMLKSQLTTSGAYGAYVIKTLHSKV